MGLAPLVLKIRAVPSHFAKIYETIGNLKNPLHVTWRSPGHYGNGAAEVLENS